MLSKGIGSILIYLYFVTVVFCHKCPTGWEEFALSCYKFTRSPPKNREDARSKCQAYNSDLLSVNTFEEHFFISEWLRKNDPQRRRWYTSGRDTDNNFWVWEGDEDKQITNVDFLWLPEERRNFGRFLAYNYSASSNTWGVVKVQAAEELGYICEILKENLHQFIIMERNLDYGIIVDFPRNLPRGPYIIQEPKGEIFDLIGRAQRDYISLRCVADGYPPPSYKWFKESYENDRRYDNYIDPLSDSRYTQTDGTLTVHRPDQINDRGKYHCTASNKYGTARSETAQLSFGNIGEFNKKRSPDTGMEFWGKTISCDPPQHYPSIHYDWIRDSFPNFVQEDKRVFVSRDGNLYFSSLEKTDQGTYSCSVKSMSSTGRHGPYFRLNVIAGSSGQKLLFPNNFPKAFPDAPLAGEDVMLECVAFGYPVPRYNWTRRGFTNRLPEYSHRMSHNRVLKIPKVKIEDMGDYVCTATNDAESIEKSIRLSIQAFPKFTVHLGNKVVDYASTLTWSCEAFGIPDVTYSWLKNNKELEVDKFNAEDVTRYRIFENILTISNVEERDEGMYQCRAANQLGAAYSTGQLRVIRLAPTFKKYPLEVEMFAAEGGNITIPCQPEAAPFPEFVWKFNNVPLSFGGRFKKEENGYLFISPVRIDDEGLFTCLARNQYGVDESTGRLLVLSQPRLYESPHPKVTAIVNSSVELQCQAHKSSLLDIAYVWLHNNLKIDFTRQHKYSVGSHAGYLEIRNISLAEAGFYQCVAKTAIGKTVSSTELIVIGPPGAPGGVQAEHLTSRSGHVSWSDGSDNGRRIITYTIEGKTNHNSTWVVLVENTLEWRTIPSSGRKETYLHEVLSPWSKYNFRVSAINEFGKGEPSDQSPSYNTKEYKPLVAPQNVGGGGGKVGSLTITWSPLPSKDWNAPKIWYKIFYKLNDSRSDKFYEKELNALGNIHLYTVFVGEENYYREYVVKVQAINTEGEGPISKEEIIFSAEKMPQIQPSQVKAVPFNSTALNVSWNPLDLHREKIRGKLIGHRIKYWRKDIDPEEDALILLKRGLDPWGLIVGLQPNTEYWVKVMAYNEAGSGVESEKSLGRTFKSAPLRMPTSVAVKALTPSSVEVTWRGILTTTDEEAVSGYKVRYWEAGQDMTESAKEVIRYLDGGKLEAVISHLTPGKTYHLRVLAYSSGGDGKMSTLTKFSLGDAEAMARSTATSYQSCNISLFVAVLTILRIF